MARIAAAFLATLLTAVALAGSADKAAARVALPVIKIERGEACVAPVEQMRRDHMPMLLHQRDRTLREGIRTTRFSLKNCVECHASRQTGSVLGRDGFCSSCHEYAAVRIDCFECHTPKRPARAAGAPR
jgi:predicted dienelactone hydrolase